MKIFLLLLIPIILFSNDDYFIFDEEYLPEEVIVEKERKLCFFQFRNNSENERFDYLSKGLPNVLLSSLNGFEYVYDDNLLINSIQYEFGNPKNSRKKVKSITRNSLNQIREDKNSPIEKNPFYLKLKMQMVNTAIAPFRESSLELGRANSCFYMITGEYNVVNDEILDIKLELTNRKNRLVDEFKDNKTLIRTYQEIGNLSVLLKRKLFSKEMSSIDVNTGELTEALVFLDSIYLGKTPLSKTELPSGKHNLTIQKDGYEIVEKTIELEREKKSSFEFTLKPIQKKSFITIKTLPQGANVYYGNTFLGKTPLNRVQVSSGQNRLRVEKKDFIEIFQGLELANGEEIKLSFNLKEGNSEEYHKTRLKVFGDYSYFDFASYSLYSVILFYVSYRYHDYRVGVQRDSIRGTVPGFLTLGQLAITNQNSLLYYYTYIFQQNEKIVDEFQNYKLLSIIGGVSMLSLSGIFYYLGIDNEAFEFAYKPAYQNLEAESFVKYNYRF